MFRMILGGNIGISEAMVQSMSRLSILDCTRTSFWVKIKVCKMYSSMPIKENSVCYALYTKRRISNTEAITIPHIQNQSSVSIGFPDLAEA